MKTLDLNLYFITDSTGFSEEEFLKRVELALQGKVTLVASGKKQEYKRIHRTGRKSTPADKKV